jgi:thiol-disulfide isomerase/thioredoxin
MLRSSERNVLLSRRLVGVQRMYSIAILSRLILAAVFATAAVMKTRDRARLRSGLVDFGVPAAMAGSAGVLLLVAEGATALALVWGSSAAFGVASALALLVVFTAAIVVSLLRGRAPACNCFGQMHTAPIGWSTVTRNVALGAIAAALLVFRSDGVTADLWSAVGAFASLPLALGGAALVLLAIVLTLQVQLMQQHGRLLVRMQAIEAGELPHDAAAAPLAGLPTGTTAPAFVLDALDGAKTSLESLVAGGKPVVLVFTNPRCGPCEALLPELAHWQQEYASVMTLALVSEGTAREERAEAKHGLSHVLLQGKREVAESYLAHGTPGAVIVGTDGRVASSVAQGADAIRRLIGECLDAGPSGASPRGLAAGDSVPPITVSELDGRDVALADVLEGRTMLLFWNPRCGFCEKMLPALRAAETRDAANAPRLVVVSSGAPEEHSGMDVRSRVVLDRRFEAASAFGASGTPMAVIVDDRGIVASELAAGSDAIFALLEAEEDRSTSRAG